MALISCSECGKEISDSAKTCIYCGMPLKKQKDIAKESLKKTESFLKESLKKTKSFFKKHKKKIIVSVSIFLTIALVAGIVFLVWFTSPAQVAKREAEESRRTVERLQNSYESLLKEDYNRSYYNPYSGLYSYY